MDRCWSLRHGLVATICAALVSAPVTARCQARPIPGQPTVPPPMQPPVDPPTIGIPGRLPPVFGTTPSATARANSACRSSGELIDVDHCVTVPSGMLVARLTTADPDREFYRLILMPALANVVVIVFDRADQPLDSKLRVVQAVYDAEVGAFDLLARRVRDAIANDASYAERLRTDSKLDDAGVAELRLAILSERQSRIDEASILLSGNRMARGFQFKCSSACRDLNNAAKNFSVVP